MKKLLSALTLLDFAVAGGLLAWGLISKNWFYATAGIVGLIIASFKPAQRVHARAERLVQRRMQKKVHNDIAMVEQADAFYSSAGLPEKKPEGTARIGKVLIDPRPGNVLKPTLETGYAAQDVKRYSVF